MTKRKTQALITSIIISVSSLALTACGGSAVSSGSVSASAISKCAHARSVGTVDAENQIPETLVEEKVVAGGKLIQYTTTAEQAAVDYDLRNRIEAPAIEMPEFAFYVFKNPQVAEEAFGLIAHSAKAEEEWGEGGTFQRANIMLTTNNTPAKLSLTATAAEILDKCSVPGDTQSVLRGTSERASTEAQPEANYPATTGEAPESEGATTEATPEVPYATSTTGEAPGESEASAGRGELLARFPHVIADKPNSHENYCTNSTNSTQSYISQHRCTNKDTAEYKKE
jgi:hypothetical protein